MAPIHAIYTFGDWPNMLSTVDPFSKVSLSTSTATSAITSSLTSITTSSLGNSVIAEPRSFALGDIGMETGGLVAIFVTVTLFFSIGLVCRCLGKRVTQQRYRFASFMQSEPVELLQLEDTPNIPVSESHQILDTTNIPLPPPFPPVKVMRPIESAKNDESPRDTLMREIRDAYVKKHPKEVE